MQWERTFRNLLMLQLGLVTFVTVLLFKMDPDIANYLKLYELFGAAVAMTLTVFGLLEMKKLTEEKAD